MDSSIHGGATVAVPGPDLRRKNSLQASSMGQCTPNRASKKAWQGPAWVGSASAASMASPCVSNALTSPQLQRMYASLEATQHRCAVATVLGAQEANREMYACPHKHAQHITGTHTRHAASRDSTEWQHCTGMLEVRCGIPNPVTPAATGLNIACACSGADSIACDQ